MGLLCAVPKREEEDPLIVDVEKILKDKAWGNYKHSFGWMRRKFLKRRNFILEMPQNYLMFERIEQHIKSPSHVRVHSSAPTDKGEAPPANNGGTDMLRGKVPMNKHSSPDSVNVDTIFSNDTAATQSYEFKFSKTRSNTCEVTFQQGYTLSRKANFSIGWPKVLGDGSIGLEAEVSNEVTKSEGQTFEESINMEACSTITVGPKSNYKANIQLEERSIQANYVVRMRMSIPKGKIPIYIKRKKDEELVYVYACTNLKDAFVGRSPGVEKVVEEEGNPPARDKVDFVVEGVIKGSLACDHNINLISDETEAEKMRAKQNHIHGQLGED